MSELHQSDSEKKKEDWMNSKWRPAMGWLYMLVCAFDFVIAPILWSLLQTISKGQINMQWQPLTLQGAGLFHLAMGAVLGIAAYGRTQEKLSGANNGGIQLPSNAGTTYVPPGGNSQGMMNNNMQSNNNFGSNNTMALSSGFGSPATPVSSSAANSFTNNTSGQVFAGFGGKPAPLQPPDPIR